MRRKTNERAVRRAQRELKAELDQTISALRRNDAAFQLAVDGYQVGELCSSDLRTDLPACCAHVSLPGGAPGLAGR